MGRFRYLTTAEFLCSERTMEPRELIFHWARVADACPSPYHQWVNIPPDLVIEVLAPRPRLGSVEERIDWLPPYGVRECWLVHLFKRETEVLSFARERVSDRQIFEWDAALSSHVLPDFHPVLQEIMIEP